MKPFTIGAVLEDMKERQRPKLNRIEILERAVAMCEQRMTSLDDPGICLACGEDADGCEPDARGHKCEACGKNKVFGAEEIVLMLGFH